MPIPRNKFPLIKIFFASFNPFVLMKITFVSFLIDELNNKLLSINLYFYLFAQNKSLFWISGSVIWMLIGLIFKHCCKFWNPSISNLSTTFILFSFFIANIEKFVIFESTVSIFFLELLYLTVVESNNLFEYFLKC